LGLALDESQETDVTKTINEIPVAIDKMIVEHVEGLKLDVQETEAGQSLVLLGNESDCC
jgi:Fe-S cluster assembly iron-binding protein IscA